MRSAIPALFFFYSSAAAAGLFCAALLGELHAGGRGCCFFFPEFRVNSRGSLLPFFQGGSWRSGLFLLCRGVRERVLWRFYEEVRRDAGFAVLEVSLVRRFGGFVGGGLVESWILRGDIFWWGDGGSFA